MSSDLEDIGLLFIFLFIAEILSPVLSAWKPYLLDSGRHAFRRLCHYRYEESTETCVGKAGFSPFAISTVIVPLVASRPTSYIFKHFSMLINFIYYEEKGILYREQKYQQSRSLTAIAKT